MQAVQPAGILGDGSAPRHRQRQEQRVQPGIVESFADVSPGGQQHPLFILGNGRQPSDDALQFLPAHAAPQDNQVTDLGRQPLGQAFEVFGAFRQHDGRPAFAHGLHDVLADEPVARLIRDQFIIEVVELDCGRPGRRAPADETPWGGRIPCA